MDLNKIKIFTNRLKLIPLSEKYAEDIFKELTLKITTFMFPRTPTEIEETLNYINYQLLKIKSHEELPVIILNKTTNEFIGGAGLHKINTETPELGIWIKESAQGNKYGIETLEGLKKWANKNLGYEYIKYPVDKEIFQV